MLFLEKCIKETMRLFSAVPFIFRNATEDIPLKGVVIYSNETDTTQRYTSVRFKSASEINLQMVELFRLELRYV